ncbi:MAG: cytochrome P450 [Chloroflexia bacterium]
MAKPFSEIPLVDVSIFDAAYTRGDLSAVMAQVADEYGPLFRWIASAPEEAGEMRLSMVGPEANRFVMHTHRQQFSHEIGWAFLINDALGRGLLTMDDPDHAVHRKMWNPALSATYMGTYLPIIQRVVEERTSTWPQRGEVDVYAEAREITFDVTAALAGFEPGPEVDHLSKLFHTLLHGPADGMSFQEFMARFYKTRNQLFQLLTGMIQQRRAAGPEEKPRDVLSLIVHARDDEGQPLTDEQVLGDLNILLVAGHETTTTLSAWALYLLSTLPAHRERLLAELASTDPNAGLSIEAIRAYKQMDIFVRETGRMYPALVNVPRGVVEDVEFAGYTIPKGTIVRLGIGACHYLPSLWTDPQAFDPDRMSPPREEDRRVPYSLVTFGGGPRVCIGQHFALLTTKTLIAHVLRNYRLEPASSEKPIHAGFFNAFIPGGMKMRVSA